MAGWSNDERRAGRAAGAAASSALALLLLAACARHAAKTGPYLLHPLPPASPGYSLASGALLWSEGPAEAEVRPLDPRFVEECLAEKGLASPFPPPGRGGSMLIFEVRLANRGADTLYFNPDQVRGVDETGWRYMPVAITDVWRLWREDPRREARLQTYTRTAFSTPVEVRGGREEKRYLALAAGPEVPEGIALTLPLRYAGEKGLWPEFAFEAFPAAEPPP